LSDSINSIIGKGAKWTEDILPKEGRSDLAKIDHIKSVGRANGVYIHIDQYLKAIEALDFSENQIRGLEIIISEERDITPHLSGLYYSLPCTDKNYEVDKALNSN